MKRMRSSELTPSCPRGKLFPESFAQLVADKRMTNAEAYRIAIGNPEMGTGAAAFLRYSDP